MEFTRLVKDNIIINRFKGFKCAKELKKLNEFGRYEIQYLVLHDKKIVTYARINFKDGKTTSMFLC